MLELFGTVLQLARTALFGAVCVLGVGAGLSWAVRTRRISPFSGTARFIRDRVDPLFRPVERAVLGAGGTPSSVPWWGLAALAVGGLLVLQLLDYVRSLLFGAMFASQAGPMGMVRFVVSLSFSVLEIAIFVRVISSWFPSFAYKRWLRWSFVLSEPLLRPIRQLLPNVGPFDLSPIVALLAIRFLSGYIVGAL
jgi:YggT family protein